MTRLSIDPKDPGHRPDDCRAFDVIFNGKFFDLGQVITVDDREGLVVYAPIVGGLIVCWPDGSWKREEARGRVLIVESPAPPLSPRKAN